MKGLREQIFVLTVDAHSYLPGYYILALGV